MLCVVCHQIGPSGVCRGCFSSLVPAGDRLLEGGLRLVPGFLHSDVARVLMHGLKYGGVTVYVPLVVDALAEKVRPHPIVPVPRSLTRRLRYGSDPAHMIATALGRRIGVPVLDLLRAPLHSPRRAGGDHRLPVGGFVLKRRVPESRVLVLDDVVTTGRTMLAAVQTLGRDRVDHAVAANVAPDVSSLPPRPPGGATNWLRS